jgi:phosphoesterase RecJ-like protein
MSLKKAVECVRKNKRFLITAHTNLEGDALGSELAFYRLLKALGKQALVVNDDKLPYGYEFLPDINCIKKLSARLKNLRFDCLAVLDCSDLHRTGQTYKLNTSAKPVLNIDHHISNSNFGKFNWVDARASSCSEMIYRLFKALGVPIDQKSAMLLYVGILTDTGSFRYPNTTSDTHKAVADLLKHDLDVTRIYKKVYENMPFCDSKLLSQILPKMKAELNGKVIWFEIKKSILSANKIISIDLTDKVLGFARAIQGVEVVALFKENLKFRDEIRVNLRSQGKIDVNKIAGFFGGGGHKTASGCTIKGKIDQARKKVLSKIKEAFRK